MLYSYRCNHIVIVYNDLISHRNHFQTESCFSKQTVDKEFKGDYNTVSEKEKDCLLSSIVRSKQLIKSLKEIII